MIRSIGARLPYGILFLFLLWTLSTLLVSWLNQELEHPQPLIYITYPELPQLPEKK